MIHVFQVIFKVDKKNLIFSILIFFPQFIFSQNTLGVLSTTETAVNGYNIFYPFNQDRVFLIDNKGQLVHYWEDEGTFIPGTSVYLLPDGNLVRSKTPNSKVDDPIYAPGAGAIVEIVSWEGEILSSFSLNNENARLHHDVEPMPNGNILLVIWEKFTLADAIQAGRDPNNIPQENILSEMIYEWDPIQDKIVWEWHAWDHLVQDAFSGKNNYGNVEAEKGKIDINYDEHDGHPDWLHINSIDYNPVLDQIVVSVPYFNELWIIDHSTTTAQAKTNEGGLSGKGGEILFRYGNNKTYKKNINDQFLYFQHNIHWLNENAEEGTKDFGKIVLFNNQMPDTTSIGVLLNTIKTSTNEYVDPTINPEELIIKTYKHPEKPAIAYSNGLSNLQIFENGHALMFSGRSGYGYELDNEGNIVWEYRIPFKYGKTVKQGEQLDENDNITFKMNRYAVDYPAFNGKDLTPKGLLEELEFTNEAEEVEDDDEITSIEDEINEDEGLSTFPNPFKEVLFIENNYLQSKFSLYSMDGRILMQNVYLSLGTNLIDTNNLKNGIYFIKSGSKVIKILKE